MGRMQVLILGLRLMLTWEGGAPSTMVDLSKTVGCWYHVLTASNQLEELSDKNYLRLYKPTIISLHYDLLHILLRFEYRYVEYCPLVSTLLEKQKEGLYQITENILEVLDLSDSMLLLGYTYRSLSSNTYAVLALGRERTLSEADMEKFQKVLQEKGIGNQTVHFTDDDVCEHDDEIRYRYMR